MRTGDDLHNEGWEITRSDGQKRFLEINTTQYCPVKIFRTVLNTMLLRPI
jgi:hypothetical protein